MISAAPDSGVRLAEVLAALSKAVDLGMGQPVETALRTCVVGMRLGGAAGFGSEDLRDTYYLALLRFIGCNAETHVLAALVGDELALRREFAAIDSGDPRQVVALVSRHLAGADRDFAAETVRSLPGLMRESFKGHCEVAQRLAERIALPSSVIHCLGQVYERWDGRGLPHGLAREAVALPVRAITLAQDMVVLARAGGVEAAVRAAQSRSGSAYEPRLAECFMDDRRAILAGLDEAPPWSAVLELDPDHGRRLSPEALADCCEAIADFADLKSPYMLGHSPAVARLATQAGRRAGLVEADVIELRNAGLVHDAGRAGVSTGVWAKAAALSEREWEQVRLHPYFTERVLAQPEALAKLGRLASQHRETLNGTGYHRGLNAGALSAAARILSAGDAYQAMTEARPYRPALSAEAAAKELRAEVRAGRLDGDAVHAVLSEAGHLGPRARRERPAGLSAREVEVLRLLARGYLNREIASKLHIAPDTVKRHIQHIYDKTGRSSRAGATLYAMESGLLEQK